MNKFYGTIVALAFILMMGSAGGIDHGTIPFGQGCWQIGCSIVFGLMGCFGLYLQQVKAARRPIRRY